MDPFDRIVAAMTLSPYDKAHVETLLRAALTYEGGHIQLVDVPNGYRLSVTLDKVIKIKCQTSDGVTWVSIIPDHVTNLGVCAVHGHMSSIGPSQSDFVVTHIASGYTIGPGFSSFSADENRDRAIRAAQEYEDVLVGVQISDIDEWTAYIKANLAVLEKLQEFARKYVPGCLSKTD